GVHVARKRLDSRRVGCARHAARRRDQHRLLGADRVHRDRHLSVPHSRTLRQRRAHGAAYIPRRSAMTPFAPYIGVLGVPVLAAAVLAFVTRYRASAAINALASLLTLLGAASFLVDKPAAGALLFIDDLNIVFIVVNAFVGFTTSVFSAGYIGHE